jgi:hypothetical protein
LFDDARGGNGHLTAGASGESSHYGDARLIFGDSRGGNGSVGQVSYLFGDALDMRDSARGGDDALTGGTGTDHMWGDGQLLNGVAASPTAPTGSVVTGTDTFVFAPGDGGDFVYDLRQAMAASSIGLHRSTVVGPLQQGLPLPGPAEAIARRAIRPYLRGMAAEGVPASDLSPVLVRHAAAHMVAAIPLEPAARVVRMDPAFTPPFRERLARIDAEVVERAIALGWRELGPLEPARGKLRAAVRHVLAAEDAKLEHFPRREVGRKSRIKAAARGDRQAVAVSRLHAVVDENGRAHPHIAFAEPARRRRNGTTFSAGDGRSP